MSEAVDGAAVRIPPPLVYLSSLPIGVLLDRYVMPLSLPLEPIARIAGTAVPAAMAIGIMVAAFGLFRKIDQDPKPWKSTPEILSTGVYHYSRNPMYVGMGLAQLSVGVSFRSGWIVVLLVPVLLIVYYSAIRHEEAYLERKFGETYLKYKRSVRRWI